MALATLSQVMAEKMDDPILHVTGRVNGWISIAVAISYYRVLCGDQSPIPLWTREIEWALGPRLGLTQ